MIIIQVLDLLQMTRRIRFHICALISARYCGRMKKRRRRQSLRISPDTIARRITKECPSNSFPSVSQLSDNISHNFVQALPRTKSPNFKHVIHFCFDRPWLIALAQIRQPIPLDLYELNTHRVSFVTRVLLDHLCGHWEYSKGTHNRTKILDLVMDTRGKTRGSKFLKRIKLSMRN